jgi:hypothetical protein
VKTPASIGRSLDSLIRNRICRGFLGVVYLLLEFMNRFAAVPIGVRPTIFFSV